MRRIRQWKEKLLFTVAAVCVAAAMWLLHIPCPFRGVLGVPCPGCGMTHALLAALRLDLATAFAYHGMFWALPLGWLYFLWDGQLLGCKWADRSVLVLLAVGFLANWVGFC